MDVTQAATTAEREDAGIVVHVEEADHTLAQENGKPVTITVAGTYSTRYRKAFEAQRRRIFGRVRRRPDADDAYRQALELVAACVISWEGFTNNGQPYPCTPANAVALFEQAPWILRQVEDAMEDHERFFRPGSPSSLSTSDTMA